MSRQGRGRGALLVVAALLVLTAGCSGPSVGTPSSPTISASRPATAEGIHAAWPGCQELGAFEGDSHGKDPVPDVQLPDDFHPTAAIECVVDSRDGTDGSVVEVAVERRATALADLLTSLAQPDPLPENRQACTTDGWVRPRLYLTDEAGRWIAPKIPVDDCGKPEGWYTEAGPAFAQLAFTDTVVAQLKTVESAAVHTSGCSTEGKNLFATRVQGEDLQIGRLVASPFDTARIRVCVYAGERASATTDPGGSFVRGGVLPDRKRAALLSALVPSPAAQECSTWASRFAYVEAISGNPQVYVELDGCRRVLFHASAHDEVAQASPALLDLLESV